MMKAISMMDPTNTNSKGRLVDWLWNDRKERLTYMGKLQVNCPLCSKTKLRWYRVWLWDIGDCLYAHELSVCLLCKKATYPTWIGKPSTKKAVARIVDTTKMSESVEISYEAD